MDYRHRPYHEKENTKPVDHNQYEALSKQVAQLKHEIKQKDLLLMESKEDKERIKNELLYVSKKETEEYANDMEIYSNNFVEMKQQEEALKRELEKCKKKEEQQMEKIQTLALGVEQESAKNQRKEEQIRKLEQQNMSLQHDKRLLQQQLQSVRDNFFNDDTLMHVLCTKLELDSCSTFNGLTTFISNAKRLNNEYTDLKRALHTKSEELEAHKIELASFKKQIEIYEDNKNIEKGHLITMQSLRAENENLRNEIRILEEGNTKLSTDLVERSQKKMEAMTQSLTKMQQEHNKMYSDYEKKLDKVRRERKSYQHKYEHFKKEAKGHASKCEELTQKVHDLEHIITKYQGNDDNISEDYERRMSELEANNDALNRQLQNTRHEMEELKLLNETLNAAVHEREREVDTLRGEMKGKQQEVEAMKQHQVRTAEDLQRLAESKALMETMWNEFKNTQNGQNQHNIDRLTDKLVANFNQHRAENQQQLNEYQEEIRRLRKQLQSESTLQQQEAQYTSLQHDNERLRHQIVELHAQIDTLQRLEPDANGHRPMVDVTASQDSSLMLINNNDTLKARLMELKGENIRLHQEINKSRRKAETEGWEATVREQGLKNQIEIMETKLRHNESTLKAKMHDMEQCKKLMSSLEDRLEDIRNKYETAAQKNARYETQITNFELHVDGLKAQIMEYKEEIRTLRQNMDSWYDKHGIPAMYERIGDSSKSELVQTLKLQNDELRKRVESAQDKILSLKEEVSSLKQANHGLTDRFESTAKMSQSRDAQITQLRETLTKTQDRESELTRKVTASKMRVSKYKVEAEQYQSQMMSTKKYNEKLLQQIQFLQSSMARNQTDSQRDQKRFQQFSLVTNQLEVASKNYESMKSKYNEMHSQLELMKEEYEKLHQDMVRKDERIGQLQAAVEKRGNNNINTNSNTNINNNGNITTSSSGFNPNQRHHPQQNQNQNQHQNVMVIQNKYNQLKEAYAKLEDENNVVRTKYDTLKKHWGKLDQDRAVALEQLETEAKRVSESKRKLATLQLAIAELNQERSHIEKEKEETTGNMKEMQQKLGELKMELKNKQLELQSVDQEKLKWKARSDRLKQNQQQVSNALVMNEVKVQEEIQMMRLENSNLKQELEQRMYEIEDVQTKHHELGEKLNEWRRKYEEVNEKFEFESAQHDNTMKKLNDLRALWDGQFDGDTKLKQLLQEKQQMIQELQSKLNDDDNANNAANKKLIKELMEKKVYFEQKYNKLMASYNALQEERDRILKMNEEQINVHSSLKTRINVQRNIIHQQQQQPLINVADNDSNGMTITIDEYTHIQSQLDQLAEVRNQYEAAQQQIVEMQRELSKWQGVKVDLDTSELIPKHDQNTMLPQDQMEQLVACLHKKEQSLHDLQEEYEQIKMENGVLINTIQQLEDQQSSLQNAISELESKLKSTEHSLVGQQTGTHSIEAQRDSMAKKVRELSASNAKLRVELYTLSSASDLVQEQLKTSAVALSTTTDKKMRLVEDMQRLERDLKAADCQIEEYQTLNMNLQNINDSLVAQVNALKRSSGHRGSAGSARIAIEDRHSAELMRTVRDERQKLLTLQTKSQREYKQLEEKYNTTKAEAVEMKTKSQLLSNQLDRIKNEHSKLIAECQELRRSVQQIDHERQSMEIEKEELNKQINRLQNQHRTLFNEHNTLKQQYEATNLEISDMKLESQSAFVQRDVLDFKVEQLKGDKSNISQQLESLRASYFEQSKKFKAQHDELFNKFKAVSGEREEFRMRMEQLSMEKQTLEKMLNVVHQEVDRGAQDKDIQMVQLQQKYDELLAKNAGFASKLSAADVEAQELRLNYQRVAEQLKNAEIRINELNMVCNDKQTDHQFTKATIATMEDQLNAKQEECHQLKMHFTEQEHSKVNLHNDMQTLLASYNTMTAENEQLHSENKALYQQLQTEQMNKFIQQTKDLCISEDVVVEPHPVSVGSSTMNDHHGLSTVRIQSLVKRGRLLTEQCADLHADNARLKGENEVITRRMHELQQELMVLNDVNNNPVPAVPVVVDGDQAVMVHQGSIAEQHDVDNNENMVLSTEQHEGVLTQLRHRNDQLMNQIRSLQHDLETDTELIDRLQKENGELRTKFKALLNRQADEFDTAMAVDGKGEPWQDIIHGLRKQLQEARREIAELCEESMGKTQHIHDVETENANLMQNLGAIQKEQKALSESLAITPKPEVVVLEASEPSAGELAKEYKRIEELCTALKGAVEQMVREQSVREKLAATVQDLESNVAQNKSKWTKLERDRDALQKRNEIVEHELSLLNRTKAQLLNHNEQLTTEITHLQSIEVEQRQKVSEQQQELSELHRLHQNVESQLEINNSLNEQLQKERKDIIQLFATLDGMQMRPQTATTTKSVPQNQGFALGKMIDLGFGDEIEESNECKMESMITFNFTEETKGGQITNDGNPNGNGNAISTNNKCGRFETLDLDTFDLKHEIECLLSNHQRLVDKNQELEQQLDRYSTQNALHQDLNSKFEELKGILIDQRHGPRRSSGAMMQHTFLRDDGSTNFTNHTNNGSANHDMTSDEKRHSLSEQLSPFKECRRESGRTQRDGNHTNMQLMNMTNPDLLNTSMQHIEEIMNTHKMMKQQEMDQLVRDQKEKSRELEALQDRYDSLSRDFASQSQRVSLLEGEHKHISNKLANVCDERDTLRSEISNQKELVEKLSKDFKSIGLERDHLYSKVRSLQQELETKHESDKMTMGQTEETMDRLKRELIEVNDLNLKLSNQIELLQSKQSKLEHEVKQSHAKNASITNEFTTMKTKYEKLNEEYNALSHQQEKLYHELNEVQQCSRQKSVQLKALEQRVTESREQCQKYEQQISRQTIKFESDIGEYQSRITQLQLQIDETKFEMVAKQSTDSNKHIEDLNDQLELLRTKYEQRLQSAKDHYSQKMSKMNEAVTKLSAARTKLQHQAVETEEQYTQQVDALKDEVSSMEKKVVELQSELELEQKHNQRLTAKSSELEDKQNHLLQDCNRRIESALKHKSTVDHELLELQQLHNTKVSTFGTRFEELLGKYQQSVQENEIIKVAKEQHDLLAKQIDHLHVQLKQSRAERDSLQQKAQLHYSRRKEEWKKLKHFEGTIKSKEHEIERLKRDLESIKQSVTERAACCSKIDAVIQKLKKSLKVPDDANESKVDGKREDQSPCSIGWLQSTLIALTSLHTTSTMMAQQIDKSNAHEFREELIELTKENERLKFTELRLNSEMEQCRTKMDTLKQQLEECEKLHENERLEWKRKSKHSAIEFQEWADKLKLSEQQNVTQRNQILRLNHDIQELEDENSGLREERRRSLEGNTNNEFLSEKVNLQRQIRVLREERDIAEKKLKENGATDNKHSLQIHQLQLQLESSQQRVDTLENDKKRLKQEIAANEDTISTLEAAKTSASKKSNELYDGNVNLEEQNRASQQEIGRLQVKADRLRQQRDYAKSKYKDLKSRFTSLEQQFIRLQSRYNGDPQTSHTMPL